MAKENYIIVECDMCGQEFERHTCHPYITRCRDHRTRKARIKSSRRRIDGINIQVDIFKQLLKVGRKGYNGVFHPRPDLPIQMVTYSGLNSTRFYRVGSKLFLNEAELIKFAGIYE